MFTEPSAAAAGSTTSTAAATSLLWGIVTDRPRTPNVRIASTAAAPCPRATSKATITQSSPSAANAALWSVGDRLCRTGEPMTAVSRVSPVGAVMPGPSAEQPCRAGGGNVALVLFGVTANA